MKNKFVPDPEFATSPISIKDADFDFSVDLLLISMVEADPFYGRENDDAIAHLSKLTELSGLFSNVEKIRNYHVVKLFPFSLKEGAKAWYDRLPYGSVKSPQDLVHYFLEKYFPAHMQHAAYRESIISNSCRMSTSLKLGGGIALYSRPGQDMEFLRTSLLIYFMVD